MAFGKLSSLEVSNSEVGEKLILDNLAIGFRIIRSNRFTANTAQFNIRNLSKATINDFFTKATTIKFSAGWEDQDKGQMTTLFIGNILNIESAMKEGLDVRYNVTAASMANFAKIRTDEIRKIAEAQAELIQGRDKESIALRKQIKANAEERGYRLLNSKTHANKVVCSLTYGPGTKLTKVMEDLYTAILGLSLDGLDSIADITLPNGFTHMGRARSAMYRINAILVTNGFSSFVDHTNCYVYDLRTPSNKISVGYLSWDSGLVSLGSVLDYTADPRSNEKYPPKRMVKVKSLLQPKVVPNSVVHVDTPELNGYFLVEEVEHYGDNQGGEFLSDILLSQYDKDIILDGVPSTDVGIA